MAYFRLILIFLFVIPAHAEVRMTLGRSGYLGEHSIGGSCEWRSRHMTEYSLGYYKIEEQRFYQVNFIYRWNYKNVDIGKLQWRPLQLGILATYSLPNAKFYLKSPSRYPSSDYYDQNAFRWGLEYGTSFESTSIGVGISYFLRVLDIGLIAIYNNHQELKYFASSGFALYYIF